MVALLRHVHFSPCVARPRASIVRVVATVESCRKAPGVRALHGVPPLRRRPGFHARRGARALRQQHLRAVQPLARSRRRWLARPADSLRRSDRAPDRRLPQDGTIVPHRRSGRRRVPSALPARSRQRLARADHRRLRGPALRRARARSRPTGRRSPTRRTPARRPTWRCGSASSKRERRAHVFGEGMFSFPVELVAGRHEAGRRRPAQQQRLVHPPVDLETGEHQR